MIHFVDTALNLAAMVRTVGLPILALGAPDGEAVAAAGVHVARVERLQREFWLEGHHARIPNNGMQGAAVANNH